MITSWQDIVLTLGNFVFIFGVMRIIRAPANEQRPPLSASVPTGLCLLIYGVVFATLGLYFLALASMATGACWLVAGWQRVWQKHWHRAWHRRWQ